MKKFISLLIFIISFVSFLIGPVGTLTTCYADEQSEGSVPADPTFDNALRAGTLHPADPDTIDIRPYFPMKVGSTWTYSRPCNESNVGKTWIFTDPGNGSLEVKITGTEQICDVMSVRQEKSGMCVCPQVCEEGPGGLEKMRATYLSMDDSGLSMVRYVYPGGYEGVYRYQGGKHQHDFCKPPLKLLPAHVKLGEEVEYSGSSYCFDSNNFLLGQLTVYGTYIVVGFEDVTVPAGSFPQCLHLIGQHFAEHVFRGMHACGCPNPPYTIEETWHASGVGVVKKIRMKVSEDLNQQGKINVEETFLLRSYLIPK